MLRTSNFSLRHTFESGQPLNFHADYASLAEGESLRYATESGIFTVRCEPGRNSQQTTYDCEGDYSWAEASREVVKRFSLGDDMAKVYRAIDTDRFMRAAIEELRGMRLTSNDPWESSLCFILSQFNNIKRIRDIVRNLRERFGERYEGAALFPGADAIALASESDLMSCGTGFRAKYLRKFANAVSNGDLDLGEVARMGYAEAKEALMGMDGVGDKVADCILLFGCGKRDAFPIDVWVKRTLEYVYFASKPQKIGALHEFADRKWPRYGGYAQQYLFQYARIRKVAASTRSRTPSRSSSS